MYKIIKYNAEYVYLVNETGSLKEIPCTCFDFEIVVGQTVQFYQDGDLCVIVPLDIECKDHSDSHQEDKTNLLRSVQELFTEMTRLHQTKLGDIKVVLQQLFTVTFVTWSLVGIIVFNLFLLIESIFIAVYRVLKHASRKLYITFNLGKYMTHNTKTKPLVPVKEDKSKIKKNSDEKAS